MPDDPLDIRGRRIGRRRPEPAPVWTDEEMSRQLLRMLTEAPDVPSSPHDDRLREAEFRALLR
jgi:hypothetical protein